MSTPQHRNGDDEAEGPVTPRVVTDEVAMWRADVEARLAEMQRDVKLAKFAAANAAAATTELGRQLEENTKALLGLRHTIRAQERLHTTRARVLSAQVAHCSTRIGDVDARVKRIHAVVAPDTTKRGEPG